MKELETVFIDSAQTGRKRGVTRVYLAQRISELDKRVLSQCAIYYLMKQRSDTDLKRYENIVRADVATADTIASFESGQAVAWLEDGTQFITRFYPRRALHVSHTPKAAAAPARYQFRPII